MHSARLHIRELHKFPPVGFRHNARALARVDTSPHVSARLVTLPVTVSAKAALKGLGWLAVRNVAQVTAAV